MVKRIIAQTGLSLSNSWYTMQEIGLGFAAAVVVGVLLGVLLESWPWLARTVYPLLVSTQTIPKVALAPLFIIGSGST